MDLEKNQSVDLKKRKNLHFMIVLLQVDDMKGKATVSYIDKKGNLQLVNKMDVRNLLPKKIQLFYEQGYDDNYMIKLNQPI